MKSKYDHLRLDKTCYNNTTGRTDFLSVVSRQCWAVIANKNK